MREQERGLEKLRAAGHRYRFEFVDDVQTWPSSAVSDFFRLHEARSLMPVQNDAHRHPNWFELPQTRRFLSEFADALTPHGFRVARMTVDGEAAACRIVLPAGDQLFLYDSGYDPKWKRYAVMANLTTWIVRQGYTNPAISWINLSTNMDRSKLRWNPEEEYSLGNLRFTAPTLLGRVTDTLQRLSAAIS